MNLLVSGIGREKDLIIGIGIGREKDLIIGIGREKDLIIVSESAVRRT